MSESQRRWIPRREAARMLDTSYSNVRRFQRDGQLVGQKTDRFGTVLVDRVEVEALARKRKAAMKRTADGELAATVFSMIKAGKSFEDIVIETKEHPDKVEHLWNRYGPRPTRGSVEERAAERERANREKQEREHEAQLRALEQDIERRRRRAMGIAEENDEWPAPMPLKKASPATSTPAENEDDDEDNDEQSAPPRRRASGGRR